MISLSLHFYNPQLCLYYQSKCKCSQRLAPTVHSKRILILQNDLHLDERIPTTCMNVHLDANLGRVSKVVAGVKEGVVIPCFRTGLREKPLILPFWKAHRCTAIRYWQVNCILSGHLSLCQQSALWLSKISLSSSTRRGYQVPCLFGGGEVEGDHSVTCVNSTWKCISPHQEPSHFCNQEPREVFKYPPQGCLALELPM